LICSLGESVRFFVGITDREWFDFLSRLKRLDEVNFWQPSGNRQFRNLHIGEPFLFKLHSPDNYIVGGGFFSHSTILPASIEHVIDRLYDQNVGYWQPDLQGLDHLGRADRGELLVDYLGISEKQLVTTVERLAADGKYELAASLLESSGSRFQHSTSVANAKRLVYLKLMEGNQNTDPFKFIIYSGKIGEHRRWPVASDETLSRPKSYWKLGTCSPVLGG